MRFLMNDDGITLAVLLSHMNNMGASLRRGMQEGFASTRKEMNTRFDSVEVRLDRVEARLDWKDVALSNIDERLDELELAGLPKRVTRLERKVFAGKRA